MLHALRPLRTAVALRALALALFLGAAPAQGQQPALTPAGSINAALSGPDLTILAQDSDAVVRHARFVSERFFGGRAPILRGAEALTADLSGRTLIVYGTPEHPWLQAHRERLPFRFEPGGVVLEGRFRAARPRVICALRNPDDLARRVVVYAATRPEDLAGINDLFHGPTEYVVADGAQTLAAGSYALSGELSAEAQARDLERLEQVLLAVHPATVDGPTTALTRALGIAREASREVRGRQEFWWDVNAILGALGDSHTSLAPLRSGPRIEFPVAWLEEGLVVTRDTPELRRGDRVDRLGGLDLDALRAGLEGMVAAENEHYLRSAAPARLGDVAVLERLGAATSGGVPVVVDRDGSQRELELPLHPPGARLEPSSGGAAGGEWVRTSFHEEADLALFVLDRCVVDARYLDALQSFFRGVAQRGIGRVAVDLRANSGGSSKVCDEFLRYVDIPAYRNYSAAIRSSEHSMAQRGYEDEVGLREYGPQENENDRHTSGPLFLGELFVLVSEHTYSSGVWFAAVLQDNGLAQVVGETPGGAPSAYGDILSFTLEESGLSYFVSYKRWLRPDPERGPATELVPDRRIPRTREDVLGGRDPVLAWLLESVDQER